MRLQILILLLSLLSSSLAQVELEGTGILTALEGDNPSVVTLDDRVGCLSASARFTTNIRNCGVFDFHNQTLSLETGVCSFADPSSVKGPGRLGVEYALQCTSEGEYYSYTVFLHNSDGFDMLWLPRDGGSFLAERPELDEEGLVWTKGEEYPPELISLVFVWNLLSSDS